MVKIERKGERKEKRETNFYAKSSEVRRVLILDRPILVLLYKEALVTTNELDSNLPSFVVSLLQEFQDVFPDKLPRGLLPI